MILNAIRRHWLTAVALCVIAMAVARLLGH